MSNYGDPTVQDIEIAVAALKHEADRFGPSGRDMERMFSLHRVVHALEALLPRSQTISLAQVKPRTDNGWRGA